MGITHNSAKIDIATAFRDSIDVGTPNGYLLFETTGDAPVARIDFSAVCGTVNGTTGVVTFSGTPVGSDTSPAGGTIEHASFYDAAAQKQAEATCATSGTNTIVLSSLTIATTDTVTLNSLSWTPPA